MPKVKLSKASIDAIPYTDAGQMVVWDTELKGFGLLVNQASKSFILQRDLNRKTMRINIGRYGLYPVALSAHVLLQFQSTGIVGNAVNLNTVLAYEHNGAHQCYIFEGMLQPRPLDRNHYYAVLGSGMLGGDPFLRFLVDIFCPSEPPTIREAIFLCTWAVQHVIDTNPGGVSGPIKMAVFSKNDEDQFTARELPENEIEEHKQAVESARRSLKSWREDIQSGVAAADVPEPPEAPRATPDDL